MPNGPLGQYRIRLQAGEIRADPAQELAAEKLESLHHALKGYQPQTGAGWKERFGLGRLASNHRRASISMVASAAASRC